MIPENMQLGATETLLLGVTIVLLLVGLLLLKSKSNRRNF